MNGNNPYQTNPEPSNREVWYAPSIVSLEYKSANNTRMNRYLNKIKMTNSAGEKFVEQIKRSQIYIPESSDDTYYYVDASKRYRPDIIAQEVYGNPVLYWVILSCNGLKHPLDLVTGITVRIPPLQSILNDERIM